MRFAEEAQLFLRINDEEKLYWYDPLNIVMHFTPEKNMRINYYFKRAYLGGRARFKLENCNRFSMYYLNKLRNLFSFF